MTQFFLAYGFNGMKTDSVKPKGNKLAYLCHVDKAVFQHSTAKSVAEITVLRDFKNMLDDQLERNITPKMVNLQTIRNFYVFRPLFWPIFIIDAESYCVHKMLRIFL